MGFGIGNIIKKKNDLYTHHKNVAVAKKNDLYTHHKNVGVGRYHKALSDTGLAKTSSEEGPDTKSDIEEKMVGMSVYNISDEAQQRLDLLQSGAADLRESGQEMTDIARAQAGSYMAPGSGDALEGIQESSSRQAQAITEMGGSPSSIGAISKVGLGEQQALRSFAKSNLAYRSEAETGLMNALRSQSQLEGQAASLESQGLEGMIAEKDKVYQSQLNKDLTSLQFDITKLSMDQQKKAAETQRSSGIFGGIFS